MRLIDEDKLVEYLFSCVSYHDTSDSYESGRRDSYRFLIEDIQEGSIDVFHGYCENCVWQEEDDEGVIFCNTTGYVCHEIEFCGLYKSN